MLEDVLQWHYILLYLTWVNNFSCVLQDVEDMVALPIPDWMSVMTYITFVYNKFGKKETSVA